jgi:hypothetical protein
MRAFFFLFRRGLELWLWGGPRTSRAIRATPVQSGLSDTRTRPTLTDRQIDSDTHAQTESDRRTTVLAPALLAEAHAAARTPRHGRPLVRFCLVRGSPVGRGHILASSCLANSAACRCSNSRRRRQKCARSVRWIFALHTVGICPLFYKYTTALQRRSQNDTPSVSF